MPTLAKSFYGPQAVHRGGRDAHTGLAIDRCQRRQVPEYLIGSDAKSESPIGFLDRTWLYAAVETNAAIVPHGLSLTSNSRAPVSQPQRLPASQVLASGSCPA